jgi:acetate---CoA ligase (ADP-forming)
MGQQLAAVARASGKPTVVSCRSLGIPGARALVQAGIPVFRDGDAAARALASMCADTTTSARGVPRVPEIAPAPLLVGAGYLAAQKLFSAAGIPVVAAQPVNSLQAAVDAAQARGYPVVLKAIGVNRKTAAGGVALAIADATQLEQEWHAMQRKLPGAAMAVEAMVQWPDAIELLVGVRRDPTFGPVLLLGLGGIHADHLDDNQWLLAPVQASDIGHALRALKAAPRLFGPPGRPGISTSAVAAVALALCDLAFAHPELDALEINPLLVSHDQAVALDARITLAEKDSAP